MWCIFCDCSGGR